MRTQKGKLEAEFKRDVDASEDTAIKRWSANKQDNRDPDEVETLASENVSFSQQHPCRCTLFYFIVS